MNRSKNRPNIDLTGQTIHRLTIIKLADKRGNNGQYYWECICSCGNLCVVQHGSLNQRRTQSCGCALKEAYTKLPELAKIRNSLPPNESAFNDVYGSYRYRALKKLKLPFELTKDQFRELTQQRCSYCGRRPYLTLKNTNGSYTYNGIDRLSNNYGYTWENSVPCCEICNKAKRDLDPISFGNWLVDIYLWQNYLYEHPEVSMFYSQRKDSNFDESSINLDNTGC